MKKVSSRRSPPRASITGTSTRPPGRTSPSSSTRIGDRASPTISHITVFITSVSPRGSVRPPDGLLELQGALRHSVVEDGLSRVVGAAAGRTLVVRGARRRDRPFTLLDRVTAIELVLQMLVSPFS